MPSLRTRCSVSSLTLTQHGLRKGKENTTWNNTLLFFPNRCALRQNKTQAFKAIKSHEQNVLSTSGVQCILPPHKNIMFLERSGIVFSMVATKHSFFLVIGHGPRQVVLFQASSHLTEDWKYLTSPNTHGTMWQMWQKMDCRGWAFCSLVDNRNPVNLMPFGSYDVDETYVCVNVIGNGKCLNNNTVAWHSYFTELLTDCKHTGSHSLITVQLFWIWWYQKAYTLVVHHPN